MKGRNGQTTNSSQNAGRGNASLKQFGTATNYRGDSGHGGSCCAQHGGWKEDRPQMAQIDADAEGITERTRVRALSSQRPPRLCVEMVPELNYEGTKTPRGEECRAGARRSQAGTCRNFTFPGVASALVADVRDSGRPDVPRRAGSGATAR
jgi:hypothetical protein